MTVSFRLGIMVALVAVSVTGCAGFSHIQGTITQYQKGVHSVSTTEMNYLKSTQMAECAADFYEKAGKWANGINRNFDITGSCAPKVMTDERIKNHQSQIDKITLYADTIKTLASSHNYKTLGYNTKALAEKINTILTAYPVLGVTAGQNIEDALVGFSEMRLEQRKLFEIKDAASKMQPYLEDIIKKLKDENIVSAQEIGVHLYDIRKVLEQMLKKDKRTGITRFSDLIEARRILQSANPLGKVPLSQTPGSADPKTDPLRVALQLNKALDAVLTANKAIITSDTSGGGILTSVEGLASRAKDVQSIQSEPWHPLIEILQ